MHSNRKFDKKANIMARNNFDSWGMAFISYPSGRLVSGKEGGQRQTRDMIF